MKKVKGHRLKSIYQLLKQWTSLLHGQWAGSMAVLSTVPLAANEALSHVNTIKTTPS
jgi:hypothetical protein